MRLKDKVAIVTGGGGGLGEGICLCLAQEGAHVAVSDIDKQLADTVAGKVREKGCRALAVKTDVSREDDVAALVDRTVKEMGDVDIMVCCAGVSGYANRDAASINIEEMPVELWTRPSPSI